VWTDCVIVVLHITCRHILLRSLSSSCQTPRRWHHRGEIVALSAPSYVLWNCLPLLNVSRKEKRWDSLC